MTHKRVLERAPASLDAAGSLVGKAAASPSTMGFKQWWGTPNRVGAPSNQSDDLTGDGASRERRLM